MIVFNNLKRKILIIFCIPFSMYGQSNDSQKLNPILESVYDSDQSVRKEFSLCKSNFGISSAACESYRLKIDSVNRANQKKVFSILDGGWPLDPKISTKSHKALFMVIQHAPLDKQLEYLDIIDFAHSRGKLPSSDYAIFKDRISVGLGKMQKFGSQTGYDQYGNSYFFPIEDFGLIDSLRSTMGLSEFSQYYKRFSDQQIYLDTTIHNPNEKSILLIHAGDQANRPMAGVQATLNNVVIGETNDKGFLYAFVPRKKNEDLQLIFRNSGGQTTKYNLAGNPDFFDIYLVFKQK